MNFPELYGTFFVCCLNIQLLEQTIIFVGICLGGKGRCLAGKSFWMSD